MNKKEQEKSFLENIDIISFEESSEILLFDLPTSYYVKERRLK